MNHANYSIKVSTFRYDQLSTELSSYFMLNHEE